MNIMKKYIAPAIILLSMSACTSDFLEVDPTVTTPTEKYYDTPDKMAKALTAAYAPLQWFDFTYGEYHPLFFIYDILADDYNGVGGSSEGDIPWLHLTRQYRLNAEQAPIGLWNSLYNGVYRANQVIGNIDRCAALDEASRNRILAEAHTLRAFYYHTLWKLWGNIPYYTVNPDGNDVSYIVPQMKADEVYKNILADLDFATTPGYLPEAVAVDEVGHFNKFAAYMLRANVVMLAKDQSRYASVLSQMKEIIGSDIYALTPVFADIWSDDGEWNAESIFEINYADNPSNRGWNDPFSPGGSIYPTFLCPAAYVGNKFASEGYGFGPVSPALHDSYDNADQRRDAGILDFAKVCPDDSYTPRVGDSGYFNYKYIARAGGNSAFVGTEGAEFNFRNNIRVYRYAEALLIAAELTVRTGGPTSEAEDLLNTVRARAFNTTLAELPAQHRRAATLDNILEEYRLEFAMEGHRFFDLLRFDKAEEVLSDRGYTASKRYLPIPQSEIDRSEGTLTQNPY